MSKLFILGLGILLALASMVCQKETAINDSLAESKGFDPNYSLVLKNPVQDKNFYLLSTILRDSEVRQVILQNIELSNLKTAKEISFKQSINDCRTQASCLVNTLKWSEVEIESIGITLGKLANSSTAFRQMIDEHLRPSGLFEKYVFANNESYLRKTWADAAKGINFIMDVYVLGATPLDHVSDGPLHAIGDADYQQSIFAEAIKIEEGLTNEHLFFEVNLQLAMALLKLNNRNEAGRFEPLHEGENKMALEKLPNVNFADFEYAVIVCLGDSPNSPGDATNISEGAKYRVELAAVRFHAGKAPFILFTGANVFPNHSPYHEAIEMKKWAMQHHNIPENAILVDPHARHTTTNLRNASRLLIRYKFPLDKKGLITTSKSQSEYVTSNRFANRCQTELGYFPVKLGSRISDLDVVFWTKTISLHADATIDPLDS